MAGVSQKLCKACGKLHPMNAMRCTCGARLIDAPTVVAEEAADGPEVAEMPPPKGPPSSDRWTCKYCHFEHNDSKDDTCFCGRARDLPTDERETGTKATRRVYILRFPFGDITFDRGLEIGRDPDFCGFSGRLQVFEKVSRKHAMLEVDLSSCLSIIDMGSTNGTYLNGSRLDHGTRAAVRVGDELSFSKGLTCQIRERE
jgi:hypothetical protein